MSMPCTDLVNFAFEIFGNRCRRLNFAVAFPLNSGKYQNILSDAIFANSPRSLSQARSYLE